ncbi:hypothetical protein [Gordonia westfalica]|uniref:Uncharacterized protein n=1 Tax=Gordonia westfalica TaxID=158898 RepID=A0A1H2IA97_9ACTN|nr:hypothetical protein [Gordonia westfalica]SDU40915.1 hypothetical protein SAMN04488548_134979 [Gordonia westfalica]
MLTLALAATLIGFVLLILGLITGTVWLAVACIVICLLGLTFLLVDVFSGRNRDSARSLEDMIPGAGRDDDTDDAVDREHAGSGGERRDAGDESPTRRNPPATPPARDTGSDAETAAYEAPSFEPGMGAPSRPSTSQSSSDRPPAPESRPAPERREGNLEDYLRSVGEPVGREPQQSGGQPPRPMPPQSGPFPSGPSRPGPRPPQYGAPENRTPSSGPQQQYGQQPSGQQSPGQRPALGQDQVPPRTDSAQSRERPRSETPETPEPRPGRRRAPDFDPLDPNWRPPLD